MWLFGRTLPLLVGDCVPDDDDFWLNYLRLMEVVDRVLATKCTESDADYIEVLISDHHHEFCRLYPGHSIIPKMHYMVHIPRLMIQ